MSDHNTPRQRPPLTRARVVDAAFELLDEEGLEGLSLRALARKLGVQVGALYWHVASKQDLVDAMADRLMREFTAVRDSDGGWDDLVTAVAHRLRGVLLSRRDAARVFVSSLGLTPNAAEGAEVVLSTLREAGFPLEVAANAMNMIATFVIGFVILEQSAPIAAGNAQNVPPELVATIDPSHFSALIVAAPDPSQFPHLAEWVSTSHQSRDEVFAAQTKLIVKGLRAELQHYRPG